MKSTIVAVTIKLRMQNQIFRISKQFKKQKLIYITGKINFLSQFLRNYTNDRLDNETQQ